VALKNILHGALLKGPKHGDAARKCCCLVALQSVLHGVCFKEMLHGVSSAVLQSTLHCTLHTAQSSALGISQRVAQRCCKGHPTRCCSKQCAELAQNVGYPMGMWHRALRGESYREVRWGSCTERRKGYCTEGTCREWGRSRPHPLLLTIPVPTPAQPQVRIVPAQTGNPSVPIRLTCHVWGFYPPEVTIIWLHNGDIVGPGDHSPMFAIPNGNWTYQTQVALSVAPEVGDTYTCSVQHASLEEPLLEDWRELGSRG